MGLPPLIIGPGVKPPKSHTPEPQERAPREPKAPARSPYVTGHCLIGNHENTANLSFKGDLFKDCRGSYIYRHITITCKCECHDTWNAVRKLAGGDIPSLVPHIAPAPAQRAASDDSTATRAALGGPIVMFATQELETYWQAVVRDRLLDQHLRRMICATILKTDIPELEEETEETRRARGSLDVSVEAVCRMKIDGYNPFPLTTESIAFMINPVDPPSQGAVHAVLMRWEQAGFITVSRKPLAMETFTAKVGPGGITQAKKIRKREKVARAKGFF